MTITIKTRTALKKE